MDSRIWTQTSPPYRQRDAAASPRAHRDSFRLPAPEAWQRGPAVGDERGPLILGHTEYQAVERIPASSNEVLTSGYSTPSSSVLRTGNRRTTSPDRFRRYSSSSHRGPSLPPLRTAFYDRGNTPPRSLRSRYLDSLPCPREPAYTTPTFRPPSLYPNKKQRTGASMDNSLPSIRPVTLPTPMPPPTRWATPTDRSSLPRSLSIDQTATRRSSIQHTSEPRRDRNSPAQGHEPPHAPRQPSAREYRETERVGQYYRTPEQTPTSANFDRTFAVSQLPISGPSRSGSQVQSLDSMWATPDTAYTHRPPERDPYQRPRRPPDASYHQPRASGSISGFDAPDRTREIDPSAAPATPTLSTGEYDSARAAFVVSSNYEYQHGKARKRTNLPKHSTEIMKNWFDQNIANPYPSEDQKAIFSNATGISMTQVSNWFINHRRRCPELRDRREKSRASETEVEA